MLLALWERDGQSQKALVGITDVEQATMANTLARMERDGLIRREADPQDNRSRLVFLTERARALESEATAVAEAINARACAELPPSERDLMLSAMRRLIATLSETDRQTG